MNIKTKNITLAVIGRPNVGKSTLFNRLIKQRKAIVDDTPGVTRDRIYSDIDWNGKNITLIDTGGLIYYELDEISSSVKEQVFCAIEEADYVLFLVDGKSGITSEDEKIANYLRKIKNNKKIILAVNKIDTEKQLPLIYEFYSLGFGEPRPISALSGSMGLGDILDEVAMSNVGEGLKSVPTTDEINITIIGRPNVGKSSIFNSLIGDKRSIVTEIPGTTRDLIDTKLTVNGKNYILIDTAGLRRKSKVSSKVERYATTRTISAIEKSDIVLFVIDVTSNVSNQDQKIASLIKNRYRSSIIIANKCDLLKKELEVNPSHPLHFIDYSKFLFTSVIENKNINKILKLTNEVYENYNKRIPTSKLNKAIEEVVLKTSPPSKKGKHLKIYYVTQANIKPPEIVFFVNDSKLVSKQYEKFLEKKIREHFDFSGSPIKLVFRNKNK